jgi:hypothetical protein
MKHHDIMLVLPFWAIVGLARAADEPTITHLPWLWANVRPEIPPRPHVETNGVMVPKACQLTHIRCVDAPDPNFGNVIFQHHQDKWREDLEAKTASIKATSTIEAPGILSLKVSEPPHSIPTMEAI